MEFSGKMLIQGEPDASSFPSGGLRATFEARGYTAWDCTSPAFLKEDAAGDVTLTIPTVFCSYNGQALDKKTPLLRSMEVVSRQTIRVLKAMGNTSANRVIATVGPEQEYFLVDKEYYLQRLDLLTCGRALFGAPAPKGQELEDQYFGAIKDRVSSYMKDLDIELWKMGISSKTKHNEVAPAQFEMAPVFGTTNVAADHNQLVMETMQKVALRHDMVCLLHEKPYAGINGSGKHNNWSLSTDDGVNLLEPGNTPHSNAQFLVVLSALLKAVDTQADIMRATCASSGNDHRLGANEAPPAIISIFLGEELTDILNKLAKGEKATSKKASSLKVGVDTLPEFPKDNTDRNRTSPFAFTGNKFEFRAVGSNQNCAGANVALNTIVAEALDEICTQIEKDLAKGMDLNGSLQKLLPAIVKEHKRIIFNGDNYTAAWKKEAARRGLPNLTQTPDALRALVTDKAIKLFTSYKVLTERELHSRYEVYHEAYEKTIRIEASCAVNMVRTQILPAVLSYQSQVAQTVTRVSAASGRSLANEPRRLLKNLVAETNRMIKAVDKLETLIGGGSNRSVLDTMLLVRKSVDALEGVMPADQWPLATYAEMMFKL